jgi:RimJ/RimL family protein N-acetyltransferase
VRQNPNLHQRPLISFYHEFHVLRVEIETERLYIRSYKDDDFENSAILYSYETLTKYFDHGKPKSRLEVENLINDKGSKYFDRGEPFGLFSIFQKKSMAFIGQIDLIPLDEPGVVEIGCIFDTRYHNQGFCPEAVRAFIFAYVEALHSNGFKSNGLPVNKIIATVHPANHASKRIIQNIGMTFDKSEERFGHPRLWFSYTCKTL